MNTITHQEVEALEAATPSQNMLLVPLSQLRPSKRNVRKTLGASITELAASIQRVGLLQNLTVTLASDGAHYEVVAGGRRLAALKLLAKKRRIAKDYAVPCLLVADASARTASLTENVQREAMHPADQFEAFADLIAEGRPIEDIAADFGVTPLVVQRRLKLANVSPRLLIDYRADTVTLDQLMALAITDDHSAQEAAFYDAPQWQRSAQALREHLTEREIDATRDALARFVGIETYEAAGGGVRRDLFSDDTRGVFLSDAALLDTLARDKLAAAADSARAEGWAWVETVPRITSAELHGFQRARRDRRTPNKSEAKRIAKLQSRQQAIDDKLNADDAEDIAEEEAAPLYEESDKLGAELDIIEQSLLVFSPEVLTMAGAIVAVDHTGEIIIHRGLLREAEAKALRAQERQGIQAGGDSEGEALQPTTPNISEKLARRLSAHRTAALQAEVARHPQVALVAVVHRLALRVVVDGYRSDDSPINISASPQDGLDTFAPDVAQSPALIGLREVRQAWAARLPSDSDALFAELLALPQPELLSLLAVCVATTVGAVTPHEDKLPAFALAQAVGLDMHPWWTPTADGYFAHVSKAKAIEAVQVFAPEHAARLAKLKKNDLASEAERLAVGTGWLPVMLRAAVQEAPAETLPDAETDESASE
ncbi:MULTISPECIES: ParB/RepB/Spo0J family partition protein [unclassified Undibacterium]|uniref:ParB/RepB/Spo0J family partition protein n=1 Tax=unclassified Undibacterium TaxID=2630295 RepID=UPI002AC89BA9|nr:MULTISPECIES: ParB N-terminal domain-containing protein [unclassified Undibacterium]MEB0139434.1 ParB N-terminal domain-containing protein [Undibacterium sp. CCC2.1]MEB0171684.1 ParB N-terminal domain-containing protein [Undibacterium sp. CCC1.1]MEB0176178.1 ParB N-terminal domain-containing protein [Undibacterium sp. CCC3.4]MEB0215029.1 ParB N-terminal domain-containing protein [Undibacterium sp. 5I2]WPX43190.1 ParB N-terminal domain-containing protein [Undibacterium sp. CCC3.4]